MSLLLPIPPTIEQPALTTVQRMFRHINAEFSRRISGYHSQHREFWEQYDSVTPDAILAEMGEHALPWLRRVQAERAYFTNLAEMIGTDLVGVLGDRFANPPRAFIPEVVNGVPTGHVTLGPPAEGHDAWGRPPAPPPIIDEPGNP